MRNVRKKLSGTVVSDKMSKTITVAVKYDKQDSLYNKSFKKISKFYAHDPNEDARIGDMVFIEETRPLSKLKRFRLVKILRSVKKVSDL
ncbi:MAG: 30S ribosomal protein S17 [Pigeon pea little leaf phytoplasma]|uniref:Small ribosomal subunit protein uS17 n=1 Tax=Candidatus Phytoplasma fabacearum TaxID=2982628 RepID=A0ABU8ZT42_9MOLU|nr:30S ribosomal protein S17 ['Bituminaria bituminosa' little leaf phytoplasma]MDV3148925.1 30S ribosomal protein S17 [Pigeon pea little leaf phytoplasma]MDO7983418.1 30S ribosomal protein S17 ['Bituminaria bituminosa' little leaf phytoplasma]MDO8023847.1 30S ribosomal protein S17 ['Bituminaria bituminosa' little leaf phytoplasma]MDO8030593.1 30S ribosomal protein S17 ['Bituminaria bituminosa' little leaf phytoplasma]MDV3153913.1 30S ribosomal protein S17 [Pigeon pea little leaf phytoplasma]